MDEDVRSGGKISDKKVLLKGKKLRLRVAFRLKSIFFLQNQFSLKKPEY